MSGKRLLAVMAALVLIMVACGDDDDASSTATTVSDEVDTPELTFDGTNCTYAGPTEVTDGVVVVELVNASDDTANVLVAKLDEGYTADDAAEYVEDPSNVGMMWFAPWMSDMGGLPPADPGETMAWEGSLDAGEYTLSCVLSTGANPPWLASGLTVVEG